MIKKTFVFLFITIGILSAVYMAGTKGGGDGEVVVEIKKGETLRRIAIKLEKNRVISSAIIFEITARISGAGGKIHAGEFLLQRSVSVNETIRRLTDGKTILRPVTIPEGLTAKEIGTRLENLGIITAKSFSVAVHDVTLLTAFNISAKNAEGYLFPETYHFRKGVTAHEVTKAMIKMFFAKVTQALSQDETNNRTRLHKMVTLASLIEKETAVASERATISSVFTNRLRKKMLLQCDPTVIYALPNFDGNIRKKDLSYDSPYNTYRYRGLPPGPIANPGLAAIEAAYNPAKGNYLYFVSKNRGEHYFSTTLKEHNRAVMKYQKKK